MIKQTIIFLLALFAVQSFEVQAQDNRPISSDLKAYKITTQSGEEVATEVDQIQPGDTIEYRLTYTNNTEEDISNLVPTLPIPVGVQYLSETAQPAISSASLSATGNNFQELPIMRQVTQENGEVSEQEVSASEFRKLRWTVDSLEAQGSVTLRARVQVKDRN